MSDFERRGADRGRDLAYAPRASASAEPTRQTTPAEQAEAACTVAARAVDDVKGAIAAVHAAEEANDPSRWHAARERADKAVAVAKKQLARAEADVANAPATAKSQLTAAKETLAEQEQAVAQLGAPPTGWTGASTTARSTPRWLRPSSAPSGRASRRRRAPFAPSSRSSARSKVPRWPGGFAPGWRGSNRISATAAARIRRPARTPSG